jgi:hypothetical protein
MAKDSPTDGKRRSKTKQEFPDPMQLVVMTGSTSLECLSEDFKGNVRFRLYREGTSSCRNKQGCLARCRDDGPAFDQLRLVSFPRDRVSIPLGSRTLFWNGNGSSSAVFLVRELTSLRRAGGRES